MRENRTCGSEGGEAKAFPTPIIGRRGLHRQSGSRRAPPPHSLPRSLRSLAGTGRWLTAPSAVHRRTVPSPSVVALGTLHALVPFLGFQGQGCDGPSFQPTDGDRLLGFFAVAVGAIIDTLERGIDLGNQFALPVPGAQFQ